MKKKLFSMALLYTLFLSSCNKENSIVEQIKTGETDLSVPTDSRVIESENNSRTSAPEGQETSEDVLMRKFAISLAK